MQITFSSILATIQALTEFLPVSSSVHHLLFKALLSPYYENIKIPLSYDVFLHLATLIAVFIFLRKDIFFILKNLLPKSRYQKEAWHLSFLVIVGTIPAVIVGLSFKELIEEAFNTTRVAGWGFFITTIFLVLAHLKQKKLYLNPKEPKNSILNWSFPTFPKAFIIGIMQSIAILPGVSRSGTTISTGLLLGLSEETSLRFSFLLSIPTILGASVLESKSLLEIPKNELTSYLIGFIIAATLGWFAIKWLVVFTKKLKLIYFATYTLILGITVLLFL